MGFIRYFFRGKEDGFVFKKYGLLHFMILILFILVVYLIVKKKYALETLNRNNKLLKIFAIIILVDQVILYLWQFGSGRFSIEMSLPLYHCRISVFFLILAVFTDVRFFKVMTIFWGLFGSVFALLMPDLYAYSFPHYTNFQFFIVHFILGWVVVDFLFVENFTLRINDLRMVLIFTNLFNIFLVIFNIFLKTKYPEVNYGYIMAMPSGSSLFNSQLLHIMIIFVLFNISSVLLYKFFTLSYRKTATWEIIKSLVNLQ